MTADLHPDIRIVVTDRIITRLYVVIQGRAKYIGMAHRVHGNTYRVLADVDGCLRVVEVTIGVDLARQS